MFYPTEKDNIRILSVLTNRIFCIHPLASQMMCEKMSVLSVLGPACTKLCKANSPCKTVNTFPITVLWNLSSLIKGVI